jgi:hypothetical protein
MARDSVRMPQLPKIVADPQNPEYRWRFAEGTVETSAYYPKSGWGPFMPLGTHNLQMTAQRLDLILDLRARPHFEPPVLPAIEV